MNPADKKNWMIGITCILGILLLILGCKTRLYYSWWMWLILYGAIFLFTILAFQDGFKNPERPYWIIFPIAYLLLFFFTSTFTKVFYYVNEGRALYLILGGLWSYFVYQFHSAYFEKRRKSTEITIMFFLLGIIIYFTFAGFPFNWFESCPMNESIVTLTFLELKDYIDNYSFH